MKYEESFNITSNLINECQIPDREDLIKLVDDIKNEKNKHKKNELQNQLITQTSKLVMKYARKYEKFCQSLTIDDLFQCGIIGLLTAVEKFDSSLGYSFTTYSIWWIKQNMLRTISDTDKTIRFPVHLEEKMYKIGMAKEALLIEHFEESKNYDSMLLKKVKELYETDKLKFTNQDILTYNTLSSVLSFELKTNDEENGKDTTLGSMIRSPQDVFEEVYAKELKRELLSFLEHILTERELDVVKKRFGFENGKSYTLQEIADMYNITRERVRQIEAASLKKMRERAPRWGFTSSRYEEDCYG